jgi:hypothetical protein
LFKTHRYDGALLARPTRVYRPRLGAAEVGGEPQRARAIDISG